MSDLISRQVAIDAIQGIGRLATLPDNDAVIRMSAVEYVLFNLPSAQPEIAENLYLYKCYITDKDGLQHEVIHAGDIRRVTGWEI